MSPRLFLWIAAKNAIHPFRRLLSRYRQRRNARFDRLAGVRTTGNLTLQELGLSPEKSTRYEATPIGFFHAVLGKLHLDYPKTVFIDLGCGKGRTLLLASDYPFRSIIGVEISEMLCQIAVENIKGYRSNRQTSSEISVVCNGIEEYEYDAISRSDHVLIYMFNPCSESVLSSGLQKLSRLVSQGNSVTIIYVNPMWVNVLKNTLWLQEIRCGETFDDSGSSFMPYVVFRSLPLPWKGAAEELFFQFGPWIFFKWRFASISNTTSPLDSRSGVLERPPVLQPITYRQMRVDGTILPTLSLDGKTIRYCPYRGKRYFIDLSTGSFDHYLEKFSGKTRNTLRRKVRRFIEYSGGVIDLRYYTSPREIIEFREHAIAISLPLYQKNIGWPFPESQEFKTTLIDEARKGLVCGFVLMCQNKPVSFAFCRTDRDIITYTIPAYDQEYAWLSPGTVLLFLMLERFFAERRFRIFDFGGQEWGYKALFGTANVDYCRVIWFPITLKNLSLVAAHYLLRQAWHGAARMKRLFILCNERIRTCLTHLSTARIGADLLIADTAGTLNPRKSKMPTPKATRQGARRP